VLRQSPVAAPRGHRRSQWCLVALAALLSTPACRCGPREEARKGRPTVVVVDPDEVGRPAPLPEVEPNDTPKQAQALPRDTWVEGTLAPEKGKGGDRDVYRVEVSEKGQVLQATLGGAKGLDLVLEAWSGKRERLARVNNNKAGEGEVLVNLGVDPGTTYLIVREAKGRSSSARYRLRYLLRPLEEGEEREPNWKATLATPLAVGGEAVGYLGWHTDNDWYRVELKGLAPERRLRVEYDGLDEVRASVAVRSDSGALLQERWGAAGEAIALPNLAWAEGTSLIYVVVRCQYTANVESRYSLRVLSSQPPGATEAEPNDKPATATELVPGRATAGILADGQDRDLYAIKVGRPTVVRVLVAPPLTLDAALALVDDEGKVIWEVDDGGPREAELMPVLWVKPPRAVIQVWAPKRQHVSTIAPYRISVEALAEGPWELEPNNSVALATVWSADQPQVAGFIHPKKDVDLYRITAKGDRLRFAAAAVPKLKLRLELLDAAGRVKAASTSDAAGTIQLDAQVEAGTEYFLRVSDTAGFSNPREEYRIKRETP
jgi:hypothetical protein